MKELKISIDSELANISLVEHFIDEVFTDFCLPSVLYGRVQLSVVEAVNNSIMHGNKRDLSKQVTVIAVLSDDFVKITVSDEGQGFDYSLIPDPTLPDEMVNISGRGLYLMKTLTDHLIFNDAGRSVSLLFFL